jgi:hypothetical protein
MFRCLYHVVLFENSNYFLKIVFTIYFILSYEERYEQFCSHKKYKADLHEA